MPLLLVMLTGCAHDPARLDARGTPDTSLADRFTAMVDRQCPIDPKATLETRAQRELRLVRAQWLLAVLARYGAARIQDYSADARADAAQLLARVRHVERVAEAAREDVGRDPNQFELYRADLIVALLETTHSAIEPTIRRAGSFVLRPNTEDALTMLGNFFKDELYADAYRVTCKTYMDAVSANPSRIGEVRTLVSAHLDEQGLVLANLSGLASVGAK